VLNVGIPGPGARPDTWRRAWGTQILPALDAFKPDLIMISAGFDAHRKDDVNCGYALGFQRVPLEGQRAC
jgi:acetoin utilization deacetylase AcuC-like enzyme